MVLHFMPGSPATAKNLTQLKNRLSAQLARKQITPAQRYPVRLPEDKVELPSPPPSPGPPPSINLITSILPPVVMIGGMLIYSLISSDANLGLMIPMLIMSLGFPIANIIGVASQKKTYQKAMERREQEYRGTLETVRRKLDSLVALQRKELETAYPPLIELKKIAKNSKALLWARPPRDEDFLSLRLGTATAKSSFVIEPPRYSDPNDKLPPLALQLSNEYKQITLLPWCLPLQMIGSVAIAGNSTSATNGVVKRLVVDLLVHHSPRDVEVCVLGDTRQAIENWEWLKWVPHTDSLDANKRLHRLAFDSHKVEKLLEYLVNEYRQRRNRKDNSSNTKPLSTSAIVVLVDDSGQIRQRAEVARLAESGYDVQIYLVFVGGRNWPPECHSIVEIHDNAKFKFVDTWTKSGEISGQYEVASSEDCEQIARALAGMDVAGSETRVPLPESVRLTEVLGIDGLSLDAIKARWSARIEDKDLLRFPIGVSARQNQLDLAMINLLPDGDHFGGDAAYHTILIGTTGGGKSEFMKSLVLGAAIRYPPTQLNFFFMDFKGGAAFSVFEGLPHVNGVVTNLSPELVERGLDSVENEIKRRQEEFAVARVQNIWAYNRARSDNPLPHLILLLDEFARGLADFPRLRETLDLLVRQGRSLGMYLILANQDVNSEVEKLLNNVGWRVALKVAKPEELAIIERTLSNPTRAGQGYLRGLRGDIVEFQAGYGGFPMQSASSTDAGEFTIYEVEADGGYTRYYHKTRQGVAAEPEAEEATPPNEETFLISLLQQAATDLHLKSAKRIYLDPLPQFISLEDVLADAGVQLSFQAGKWRKDVKPERLIACWGALDMPQECRQELLQVDFEDRDGHLWIVGAPGSGRDASLASLIMSLALTHTPEQLQFYMLELGAGNLKVFEDLPHTGSVIRPRIESSESKERLVRLLNFLDAQLQQRTARRISGSRERGPNHPALVVVINNFKELQASFADDIQKLSRIVSDGMAANIHLIVTTNRGGPELPMSIRNLISRRLVLKLASDDEYIDIVGKRVNPLKSVPGRGYWVDGPPYETQTVQPPAGLIDLIGQMKQTWKGEQPARIETLPDCIPLSKFLADLKPALKPGKALISVGRSYETLEQVAPDILEASPSWLILGPRESGKSNFLAVAASSVLHSDPENWEVRAFVFRRSPLVEMGLQDPRLKVLRTTGEIVENCKVITEAWNSGKPAVEGKRLLLLVDDLGFVFQPGKETLAAALNNLAFSIESAGDVVIMATGALDELRMQLASAFLKYLRQNRTGLVLSKDITEMDWLGAQISIEQRRLELPRGRGFFINKGRPMLVQTPLMGDCPG